jgi:ABC-type transport system involved in multi-copper enzyme maturation permease subunit
MMLCYKAWRESRMRFLLGALALAGLCAALVVFSHDASAGIGDGSASYHGYVWHITYKSYLRELFVLMTLLLGAGGMLRERAYHTSFFTLALPVSRWRLVSARASVGVLEIGLLSLLPAIVLCSLSPLIHQSYPFNQALQFSLLWTICGTAFFTLGFLSSVIFPGEFTAPLVSLCALLFYSVVADIPAVERYLGDIHDIMSGEGMPYFRRDVFLLTGTPPWTSLAVIGLVSLAMLVVAGVIMRRQDF